MNSRVVWICSWLLMIIILVLRVYANDANHTVQEYLAQGNRANRMAEDYVQKIGHERERAWKLKRGRESVKHGDIENCTESTTTKKPVCEICLLAMNSTFSSEETARLLQATFLRGTLVFPDTKFEAKSIDVIMCTYYPTIGIARFYLSRGEDEKSAYLVNNAGNYKFTLHGKYVTWN